MKNYSTDYHPGQLSASQKHCPLYTPPWSNSHFSLQSNSLLVLLKNNFPFPFRSCHRLVSGLFAVPVPVTWLRFWATRHSQERHETKWFGSRDTRACVRVCPHLPPLWRAANQTSCETCLNRKEQKDKWTDGRQACKHLGCFLALALYPPPPAWTKFGAFSGGGCSLHYSHQNLITESTRFFFPLDPRFYPTWNFQVALVLKNLPADAGDIRDIGSIPGSGRSPGGGHGTPLQYSCLENPMDGGAWWLQSMGSHRGRHEWSDLACTHANGQIHFQFKCSLLKDIFLNHSLLLCSILMLFFIISTENISFICLHISLYGYIVISNIDSVSKLG